MKNKIPETGDSIVVDKDGSWFVGIVTSTPTESKDKHYQAVVTTAYPTLDGKIDGKIKAGDKISVSLKQIKNINDESMYGVRPHICLVIENGSIAHIRRVDGKEENINIKVIDEDDGTIRMFTSNAHSFSQVQDDSDESPSFI